MTSAVVAYPTARITVDLPQDDYIRLKVAAASGGRGSNMSSLVRQLIHDYLEAREDAADVALVHERAQNTDPSIPDDEVKRLMEERRRQRQ
jgi:Arc/MetJ-type ribon-helix-helix transcriptional regulator